MRITGKAVSAHQQEAGADDAPVLSDNCYHAVIGGERGGVLSGTRSLSRLSFRWQVSLLGTLVVMLSLAVLLAIVATLSYTKSAVLSSEKKKLAETARNLAQEYEDRADSARRNNQQPPLDNPDIGSSPEVLSLTSRLVLQNLEGIGGGFYSLTDDKLAGEFYPAGDIQNSRAAEAEHQAIVEVARSAATSRVSSEKVIVGSTGLFLIGAMPVREGYSVIGSAWTVNEL